MADEVVLQVESALNTLLSVTEKSGNLRKDLKRDIDDSVSTLTSIFVNLKNSAEEYMAEITQLESEAKKLKEELQEGGTVMLPARLPPSMDGIGGTPATSMKQVLTSSGCTKKIYSDVTRASIEKGYKLMVKSKSNQSPETVKNVLKTNINQTEMKIGIKTLKSLKDGRVLY